MWPLELALVALVALPHAAGAASRVQQLQGVYHDPNHYQRADQPTFSGYRMISAVTGGGAAAGFRLIGTDDGAEFWSLTGSWKSVNSSDCAFVVNFAPKDGPANLPGTCDETGITWWPPSVGSTAVNTWKKVTEPCPRTSLYRVWIFVGCGAVCLWCVCMGLLSTIKKEKYASAEASAGLGEGSNWSAMRD